MENCIKSFVTVYVTTATVCGRCKLGQLLKETLLKSHCVK